MSNRSYNKLTAEELDYVDDKTDRTATQYAAQRTNHSLGHGGIFYSSDCLGVMGRNR